MRSRVERWSRRCPCARLEIDMRHGRFIIAFLAAVLISRNAAMPAEPCATASEQAALRSRAVQTDLMLAALNCDERARYNLFVQEFRQPLAVQSGRMRAYFQRAHGGAATEDMNAFVTRLANMASQRYIQEPSRFCAAAKEQLTELLAIKPAEYPTFAARQVVAPSAGVKSCPKTAANP